MVDQFLKDRGGKFLPRTPPAPEKTLTDSNAVRVGRPCLTKIMADLFSTCCGAENVSRNGGDMDYNDIGVCPECHEHCGFVGTDEIDGFVDANGEPVTQYVDANGFLTDTALPRTTYRPSPDTIVHTVLGHICLFMLGAFMAVSMLFTEDELWANAVGFWGLQ